jgi:hypothetical protein
VESSPFSVWLGRRRRLAFSGLGNADTATHEDETNRSRVVHAVPTQRERSLQLAHLPLLTKKDYLFPLGVQ